MKFEVRKPSLKKSINASTTGKAKRASRIIAPKNSAYDKVYKNMQLVSGIYSNKKNSTTEEGCREIF